MGVLKTLTDEYFGTSIRKEDEIDIDDLYVEIVSFTDKNGIEHRHGYRVKDDNPNKMVKTLKKLIERIIEKRGNECSLNDIDVSNITQMWIMGRDGYPDGIFEESDFNGDISGWDVSNVESMDSMFVLSGFTGEHGIFKLEKGNKVEDMYKMFYQSCFNGDLSKWDIQNVTNMELMFAESSFTGKNGIFKLEKGNKIIRMWHMFTKSDFEGDINDWVVNNDCSLINMFALTPLERKGNLPKWYLKRTK